MTCYGRRFEGGRWQRLALAVTDTDTTGLANPKPHRGVRAERPGADTRNSRRQHGGVTMWGNRVPLRPLGATSSAPKVPAGINSHTLGRR